MKIVTAYQELAMACATPLTQYVWSNDSVFELIDMVRERPALWNTTLDEHRDRIKKQAAWREIAEHFRLDKSVVEKKMRMMIGQYRREMARIADGTGRDSSKWFAFQRLSFLSGEHELNGASPSAAAHAGSAGSHTSQNNNELGEDRMYDEEEYSEDSMSCQKLLRPSAITEPRAKRPRLGAKRPHHMTSTDHIVKMLFDEKSSRDEFVVYGEYVANKLRNIQSQHARNTAQYHINNILYRAETGVFDAQADAAKASRSGQDRAGESQAERWDNESVASAVSTHSFEGSPMVESVQIKMEET